MNVYQLPVQIPVQLLLEIEAYLLHQDVSELECELSRMYSKVPIIHTVRRASSALHSMYYRTGIRTGMYNRHITV